LIKKPNYLTVPAAIRELEKIVQKHKEYNALTEELQKLLDERYPERNAERVKEALYDAYQKSDKSLEDVIELIRNPDILDYI